MCIAVWLASYSRTYISWLAVKSRLETRLYRIPLTFQAIRLFVEYGYF
jgi:hypothetical protein